MTIQDLREKCKQVLKNEQFLTGLIIVLVGVSSFGLGRISVLEKQRPPVRIEYGPEAVIGSEGAVAAASEFPSSPVRATPAPGAVLASKTGTTYYLPWCTGAKRIKEQNKVWFASKTEAEKAGYHAAGNCKGI